MIVTSALLAVCLIEIVTSSASSDFWTRRHLGNGKLYVFDAISSPPGDIQKVRIIVTESGSDSGEEVRSAPIHTVKLRWSPARNAAAYRVHCEANTTDEVVTILDREILLNTTGVDERFVLPQRRLSVICGVAAANSHGSSKWTYSPMVALDSSGTVVTPSFPTAEPKEDNKQISTEDIEMDQLLKLIHASKKETIPMAPIVRPPEERVIIRPSRDEGTYDASVERAENLEFVDGEMERDYETLEEDIRRAIGSTKGRRMDRLRRLQMLGLVDRLL